MRKRDTPSGFEALDPAWEDSGYWDRFQDRTLALVEPELARRRQTLERMTVADVVLSWSRAVVPMAMAAAAAALIVLSADADATETDGPVPAVAAAEASVDDAEGLDAALDGGPIPALAEEEPNDMPVVLTAAVEGF